ncbi:MAG: YkgJ family cysteine cluster protein [Deltaproteobacteria bacterium]|nr:MAG: YkgJ family cysteine cluster protein [Deltaproteobacteria bacterium]
MTSENPEAVSLYQQKDQGLSWDSRFRFHCHGGLSCFNRCCRTPTILLSPYDILRLKQFLGLSSREFLDRYTRREIDEWSHLPLVFIDPFKTEEPACPFLGEAGCTVYSHRPAACRLFPITMGSQMAEQGMVDHYFCRQLDYCRGFAGDREWTLESWTADQGFEEYDEARREWLKILLKRGLMGPRGVDAELQDLFALASYDLDQFRSDLAEEEFLQVAILGVLKTEDFFMDDLALLHFSYRYLQDLLLGEEEEG